MFAQLALLPGRARAPTDRSAATAPRPAPPPPARAGSAAHAGSPTAGWRAVRPRPATRPPAQPDRAALKLKLELHRIDVRSLRIVERMEQQPLLQRRQRQDVLDRPVPRPPAVRSRLASDRPAPDRSASIRRRRAAPHAGSAPSAPGTRSRPDRGPPPRRAARRPTSSSPSAAGRSLHPRSAR